jgi:hypothetical protein
MVDQRSGFGRAWQLVLAPALFATLGCTVAVGCSASGDESDHSAAALGEHAQDPTGMGPNATTSSEYKFDATTDPDVLGDRMTEVWARVYRPADLGEGKHPLLVFLHGNHGTCGHGSNPRQDDSTQYTTQGTCPSGYVVTPNHEGYGYVADRLASWGYIVVSINANRGITGGGSAPGDSGVNLARGRLILKHLSLLSQWNAQAGTTPSTVGADLAGKIDFDNVGMMGHSRGGEGVRAAYTQYLDQGSPWPAKILSPVTFKAIFEIGPVDGQTSRTLNALGTAWNVVLPMCDGDVSNLQGMRPFDRMLNSPTEPTPNPKGMFAVWGANHNYFNTEWQESDSTGCHGGNQTPLFQTSGVSGSTKQQTAGMHALMGFFRAHVGANAEPAFNNSYDTRFAVPESLEAVTRIERAYADAVDPGHVQLLENFSGTAGTSLAGQPTIAQNLTVRNGGVSEHDGVLKAASVTWTSASSDTFFEIPWSGPGTGVDASTMKTLDFRVSLQSGGGSSAAPTSFSIQLVNADDTLSDPVKMSDYVELFTPGGHIILDSARIPLGDFHSTDLTKVRGVRFTFDDTGSPRGSLYLASLRFSRFDTVPTEVTQGHFVGLHTPDAPHTTVVVSQGNDTPVLRAQPSQDVEVELKSATAFHVTDELPRLRVGDHDVAVSRYADDGDTHKIIFKMTAQEFAQTPQGAAMKVRYGADAVVSHEWDFGAIDKSSVQ